MHASLLFFYEQNLFFRHQSNSSLLINRTIVTHITEQLHLFASTQQNNIIVHIFIRMRSKIMGNDSSTLAGEVSAPQVAPNIDKPELEESIDDAPSRLYQRLKSIRYKTLKLSQLLCAIYILIMTFRYYPAGLIDPFSSRWQWRIVDVWNPENTDAGVIQLEGDPFGQKRAVVAKDRASMIFLGISRISAFTLYPPMILIFMTKCKATINFLMKTPVSLFMVDDQHELHAFCGRYIAIDVWIHTIFHCLRWGIQGNINLLWTNQTGLSGLIVVLACPLITFPMFINTIRLSMTYEVRKALHYLFYLFAIGMCFHNKTSAFPNGGFNQVVMGFCIVYYTLDALYVMFFMTGKDSLISCCFFDNT